MELIEDLEVMLRHYVNPTHPMLNDWDDLLSAVEFSTWVPDPERQRARRER